MKCDEELISDFLWSTRELQALFNNEAYVKLAPGCRAGFTIPMIAHFIVAGNIQQHRLYKAQSGSSCHASANNNPFCFACGGRCSLSDA